MTAFPAAAEPDQSPAPGVEALSELLDADMAGVNRVITEQMQSSVPLIPQLAGYLVAAGGKRLRPLLTLACARMAGYEGARHIPLAACVEFIHTATLLHDDVVDDSDERRGQATANLVFGNEASVLVGDFLFARAFELMVEDGSLDVLRILSRASAVIAEGEVMQLAAINDLEQSNEDYLAVIGAKTAALFAAACEVGGLVAGIAPDRVAALRLYGQALGIAFQIADDVLDYAAPDDRFGKARGDDFREGKATLPVLLAARRADAPGRAFWQRTIGEGTITDADLGEAVRLMTETGALTDSLALAREHAERASARISGMFEGPIADQLIAAAHQAVSRSF